MRFSLATFFFISIIFFQSTFLQAQSKKVLKDSISLQKNEKTLDKKIADTIKKVKTPAQIASFRSAVFPGWGQIYNKKYWKLPLVYGALAFPISTYSYNKNWYQKTRFAYTVRMTNDSANFGKIAAELVPLSKESLRLYRNEFRKNMDFSVIGVLLMWGLNIVDATVDGHLRTFDISDDLTVKIKPTIQRNLTGAGLSLTFNLRENNHKNNSSYIK